MKCQAVKSDGTKCLQSAIPGSDPPRCFFHIRDYEGNQPRQRKPLAPLTDEEMILILSQEVRRLSKSKGRTKEILACLERLDRLKAPKPAEPGKDVRDMTAEERLALRGK